MRTLVVLFSTMLVLLGCRTAASPASTSNPSSCPIQPQPMLSVADYTPIFPADFAHCITWQPAEGDGHTIRIVMFKKDKTVLVLYRMNDVEYAQLNKIIERLRTQYPNFATRKVWILCRPTADDDEAGI